MPAVRQPLRNRCNVQLSIVTCISDIIYEDMKPNPKDKIPIRGRPQKRQRKAAAKRRKRKNSSSTLPHPNLQSYCELIPFLSIALSDGLFDPSILLPPTTSSCVVPFTHFIKVQYPTPLLNSGLAWSEYHLKSGTSVLNLIVPKPQKDQKRTFLSEHQLLLSRDFLSLALPYYCRSQPPPISANQLPSADMVHVLITAPPGPSGCLDLSGVVDVMSIVTCYLTFAGGEETTTVVECVDNEMDGAGLGIANVWKGRVQGDGVDVIQRVALAP